MYKVLATCGNGMGSSLLMEMKVKSVFDNKGIVYEISHCSLGEAKTIANNYDIIFCPMSFRDAFSDLKEDLKLIPLQNVLSEEEIIDKCEEYGVFV